MKFIINETGEEKELNIIGANGIDWTQDLIGGTSDMGDTIIWDDEKEIYKITQDTFDFWEEYIANAQADDEKLEELKSEYDGADIQKIINEEMNGINDYDMHHGVMESIFERIVEEARKI